MKKLRYDYLIVGAGLAGAVMAERIASQLNKKVLVVEKRNHIGGNAYDEYDDHGVLVHRYGPHIFHTNSKVVFDYLSRFTEWRFYEHKVLAKLGEELYPIPINRITLNKLYNLNFKTDEDVANYYESIKENRYPIKNSEDIIVNQIGMDLFEKFFKNYTKKQWSLEPKDLSPAVCGRISVRNNEDCRYFTDKYQFMPKQGYTKLFEKILSHKNIDILLKTDYKTVINEIKYEMMIYTGPIEYYFDYKFGRLPYRSIRFEFENKPSDKYQEAAVVNHVDFGISFTRVTEYKYLTEQISDCTSISKEYPQIEGEPYYPVHTEESKKIYNEYYKETIKVKNVFFCGRLGKYKYYNMDQAVAKSLNTFKHLQVENG